MATPSAEPASGTLRPTSFIRFTEVVPTRSTHTVSLPERSARNTTQRVCTAISTSNG